MDINPYTLICWGVLAFPFVIVFLMIAGRIAQAQQRNERASNAERALRLREQAARRAEQLHSAKLIKEDNTIALVSLKIEIERLKLAEIEKRVNPPDWRANDPPS